MRTLIELVRNATGRLTGIETSFTALVNNTQDVDAVRWYNLANAQILSLVNTATTFSGWRALQKVHNFTTVSGAGLYELPSDFLYEVHNTAWNLSDSTMMKGALTPQEMAYLKGKSTTTAVNLYYRFLGNNIEIFPTPQSVQNLTFSYVSKNGVVSNDLLTAKETFTSDNDFIVLDEELFVLGLMWRWKSMHGLDFSMEKGEYDVRLDMVIARDGGMRDIALGFGNSEVSLIGYHNIPESGYGL